MQMTKQQQQALDKLTKSCEAVGVKVRDARSATAHVVNSLDEFIGQLEDPAERVSWSTVRHAWAQVDAKMAEAITLIEA